MMSRAHRASQRSLPCGSFTVRTSSPVIPVLGLSSGDWVPWASERTRGGYVGKTVGEITDPAQKKTCSLLFASEIRCQRLECFEDWPDVQLRRFQSAEAYVLAAGSTVGMSVS